MEMLGENAYNIMLKNFIIISPDESWGYTGFHHRRRNFLVYAITQKWINFFFNLVSMVKVAEERSLF